MREPERPLTAFERARREQEQAEYEELHKFVVDLWNKEPLTTEDVPSATEPGSAKTRGSGSEPQAKGHRVCAIEADDDVPPAINA
jgi:hypothetical protein